MATQAPIKIRDADAVDVNTSGTLLDNGHTRPSVGIGGPDAAAGLAPCTAADGLSVKVTNPGDISGGAGATPSTRQDTYTGTADGTAVDVSTSVRLWFGLQVKGTGAAATSWTANLQASLDGTNYATILTHSNASDSDGSIVWISTPAPALHFRSSVSAVSLGAASNIVVTIVGMP
jgi:hypothetical protein